MAALGAIRKRGVILVIIIGLGLFGFIAEELVRSCTTTSNERRMRVGEVMGENLSYQEYQALVEQYEQVIKLTQGKDNFTEDETNSMRDQVWKNFVTSTILSKECAKLGITVTDEEMELIISDGTHQLLRGMKDFADESGRFDVAKFKTTLDYYQEMSEEYPQALETYKMLSDYWSFIETTLRQQVLQEKYSCLLAHCVLSNPISAEMSYNSNKEEKTINLASLPYSSISDDSVKVSEAEIKSKYKELKESFKNYNETRDIDYVAIQVKASQEDRAALQADMESFSQDLKNDEDPSVIVRKSQSSIAYLGVPVTKAAYPSDIVTYIDSLSIGETSDVFETTSDNTFNVVKLLSKISLPDSIEFRQIHVADRDIDVAHTRADSIFNAIKAGADFEEIAKIYAQTGEKAWMTSEKYEKSPSLDNDTKAWIELLNTAPEGVLQNLTVAQGNIIIEITQRKNFTDKYIAAVLKHSIDFSKETYSSDYNKFSQFVSECKSADDIRQNADKMGYRVQSVPNVQNTAHYIGNIRGTHDALRWVFGAKVDDISPLYECGDNDRLLVVGLTNIHKVGYLDMKDPQIYEYLRSEVLRDKKYEIAKSRLQGVSSVEEAKAKGAIVSDSIAQITFASPVSVTATLSSEPALSGAVAATSVGSFCSKVIKGNGGAYVFSVIDKNEKEGEYDAKSTESSLRQQNLQNVMYYGMSELQNKSNVVDKRYQY